MPLRNTGAVSYISYGWKRLVDYPGTLKNIKIMAPFISFIYVHA